VFLVTLVAGAGLVGIRPGITQGTGSTVKAPFRIVNDEGQTLLQVDVLSNGYRRLVLFNSAEKPVAVVGASDSSGGVVGVTASKGKGEIALEGQNWLGNPRLDVRDSEGVGVASIGSPGVGEGSVSVMSLSKKRSPGMAVLSANGERASLLLHTPTVTTWIAAEEERGLLKISEGFGRERVTIVGGKKESFVACSDKGMSAHAVPSP
jgi:hypothetical protein